MTTTLKYKRISVPQMARDFAAAFKPYTGQIGGLLLSAEEVDGTITLKGPRLDALLDQAGDLAQQMYTGPEMTPASVFAGDGVTARSPFARVLNEWYVKVVYRSVKTQHDWMRRRVPEDVYLWLQTVGRPVPLAEGAAVQYVMREQDSPFLRRDDESIDDYKKRLRHLRIFEPNPLAEYEAMHTWVDPGGYTLSRRIWRSGVNTRLKLDAMLRDAIAEGKSAREIARLSEQFLLPGRALLRTNKPYGTTASFDGMRLARTEIASAANRAAEIAAYMNPYVDRADIARSANGDPTCPVCPQHATVGFDGQRGGPGANNSEPWPIERVPIPVYHPHCMCRMQPVVTATPAEVTAQMRAVMQDARRDLLEPYLTPVQQNAFIRGLLGDALFALLAGMVGAELAVE